MRATNGRPYNVAGTADKNCTHGKRGTYGFVGTFVTVPPQKMYRYNTKANCPHGSGVYRMIIEI